MQLNSKKKLKITKPCRPGVQSVSREHRVLIETNANRSDLLMRSSKAKELRLSLLLLKLATELVESKRTTSF